MNNDYLLNSIGIGNFYEICGYALCILLILVGIIIIIQNKSHKKALKDEKDTKNNIDKLVNKDKKENIVKTFNPDSIFKKLPNFSNKTFFENIENCLKTKKENIKIIRKEIIDFKDEEDKYTIICLFTTRETDIEKNIIVTSEKYKENNIEYINCPTCGGKIKDVSLSRCKYCSMLLPKRKNTSTWEITDIKN